MSVTIEYNVPTLYSTKSYSSNVLYYNQSGNVEPPLFSTNIVRSKAYKIKEIQLKSKNSSDLPSDSMIILFFQYNNNDVYHISVPISSIPFTYKPEKYLYPYIDILFISDSPGKSIQDLQVILEIDKNDINENPIPIEKIAKNGYIICLQDSNGSSLRNLYGGSYMLDYECKPLSTTTSPQPLSTTTSPQPLSTTTSPEDVLGLGVIIALVVIVVLVLVFIIIIFYNRKKLFSPKGVKS